MLPWNVGGLRLVCSPDDHAAEERWALLQKAVADPSARKELINVNTGNTKDDAWLRRLLDLTLAGITQDALVGYMSSWIGTRMLSDLDDRPTWSC